MQNLKLLELLKVEATGAEGLEEDLWSMEEIPEAAEEPAEEAIAEDQGFEEAFEIMEEATHSCSGI